MCDVYQVNNTVKNQAWFMQEDREQCKNGRRGSTRHTFLRWITPTSEDDVPYITSRCRSLPETWGEFIQISLPKYRKQKQVFNSILGNKKEKNQKRKNKFYLVIREVRDLSWLRMANGRHFGAESLVLVLTQALQHMLSRVQFLSFV